MKKDMYITFDVMARVLVPEDVAEEMSANITHAIDTANRNMMEHKEEFAMLIGCDVEDLVVFEAGIQEEERED